MPAQSRERRLPRIGDDYFEVVEGPLELALQPGVVLDNQQLGLVLGHERSDSRPAARGFANDTSRYASDL